MPSLIFAARCSRPCAPGSSGTCRTTVCRMTRMLRETGCITENEKTVFCAFQFSAGGTVTNYLASGAALFSFVTVPIVLPLVLIFVLKIFGAYLVRIYLNRFEKESV